MHMDISTLKIFRYLYLEVNCTVIITLKKKSQALGMNNAYFFFHLSEIQEQIACKIFGIID